MSPRGERARGMRERERGERGRGGREGKEERGRSHKPNFQVPNICLLKQNLNLKSMQLFVYYIQSLYQFLAYFDHILIDDLIFIVSRT